MEGEVLWEITRKAERSCFLQSLNNPHISCTRSPEVVGSCKVLQTGGCPCAQRCRRLPLCTELSRSCSRQLQSLNACINRSHVEEAYRTRCWFWNRAIVWRPEDAGGRRKQRMTLSLLWARHLTGKHESLCLWLKKRRKNSPDAQGWYKFPSVLFVLNKQERSWVD